MTVSDKLPLASLQVVEQWGLYDGYDPKLEKVLRYRRRTGRHMPVMNVIPPGLDFSNLKVIGPQGCQVDATCSSISAAPAATCPS